MKMKHYLRGLATGIVIAVVVMSLAQRDNNAVSDEEIRERAAALGMVMAGSGTLAGNRQTGDGEESQSSQEGSALHEKDETKGDLGEGIMASQGAEESSSSETEEGSGETKESEDAGSGEESMESEEPKQTEENPETAESGTPEGSGESREPDKNSETAESNTPEGSGESREPDKNPEPAESNTPEGSGESQKPDENPEMVAVTIYPGSGSLAVARLLKEAGLVENEKEFDKYLCDNGYDNSIRVGVFQIPAGSGYETIAGIITAQP